MTRGYVLIVSNKKIVAVAYSNSDSYYAELGVQVLDAFEKGRESVLALIEKLNGENERFKEDIEGFCFEWYRKTKENADSFFVDYVYEYNADKKTLTVYYYGTKILSFGLDSIDLARFVFESKKINYAFAYNPTTLDLNYEVAQKEIRKAFTAKMSVEDLSAIVEEKYGQIGFYLSSGKIRDVWGERSYIKEAKTINHSSFFKFIISHATYSKKTFDIFVQTPFIRIHVTNKHFSSEKAALKELRQILINKKDLLTETSKIYTIWEEEEYNLTNLTKTYETTENKTEELFNKFVDDVRIISNRFKSRLTNEVSDNFFTFCGSFTKELVGRQFHENAYNTWNRLAKEFAQASEQ